MPIKWLLIKDIANDLGYKSPTTIRTKIGKLIEAGVLDGEKIFETYRVKEASYLKAKEAGVFDVKQRRVPRGTKRPENLKPNS